MTHHKQQQNARRFPQPPGGTVTKQRSSPPLGGPMRGAPNLIFHDNSIVTGGQFFFGLFHTVDFGDK